MSLSCGFVGLPNVGKSTIFNALLKKSLAAAANYPFCTIEPNIGKVPIDDFRLDVLASISNSNKIIPALLTCVDIAGLVKGANKGEGLGNQFLANIRECDLIVHVLRCFEDKSILHVEDSVNPLRDFDIINYELQCCDLMRLEAVINSNKNSSELKTMAKEALDYLYQNNALRNKSWNEKFDVFFKTYGFITYKPMLVLANIASNDDLKIVESISFLNPIVVYASIEILLQEVEDQNERLDILKDFEIEETGISNFIQKAYDKLNLMSYFTTGKEETRAWTVHKWDTLQKAAGIIHSDFEKHFISADVVRYNDFVECNGWGLAKEKGLVKTCSKDTLVHDGDICLFKSYK